MGLRPIGVWFTEEVRMVNQAAGLGAGLRALGDQWEQQRECGKQRRPRRSCWREGGRAGGQGSEMREGMVSRSH